MPSASATIEHRPGTIARYEYIHADMTCRTELRLEPAGSPGNVTVRCTISAPWRSRALPRPAELSRLSSDRACCNPANVNCNSRRRYSKRIYSNTATAVSAYGTVQVAVYLYGIRVRWRTLPVSPACAPATRWRRRPAFRRAASPSSRRGSNHPARASGPCPRRASTCHSESRNRSATSRRRASAAERVAARRARPAAEPDRTTRSRQVIVKYGAPL